MSTTYTPSAAGPLNTSFTHAADGDGPPAVAAFNTPLEGVEDDIAFLSKYVTTDGATDWIHVPLGYPLLNTAQDWTNSRWSFVTSLGLWMQDDDTDAGELWWPVPVPYFRGRIVEHQLTIDGNLGTGAASHANPPGTMPTVTLYQLDAAAATPLSTISAVTDPTAVAATYDSAHDFGASGLTADLGPNISFLVKVTGEAGADKLPDELCILQYRVRLERTP